MNIALLVMRMVDPIRRTWSRGKDELGASLVEYALLLALIAVVAIVALNFLSSGVNHTLSNVGTSLGGS